MHRFIQTTQHKICIPHSYICGRTWGSVIATQELKQIHASTRNISSQTSFRRYVPSWVQIKIKEYKTNKGLLLLLFLLQEQRSNVISGSFIVLHMASITQRESPRPPTPSPISPHKRNKLKGLVFTTTMIFNPMNKLKFCKRHIKFRGTLLLPLVEVFCLSLIHIVGIFYYLKHLLVEFIKHGSSHQCVWSNLHL